VLAPTQEQAAQHRLDFFLRHLSPCDTMDLAVLVDDAIITAAASLGY
jgi:hypothetical protein